jgi:hypothetical protein
MLKYHGTDYKHLNIYDDLNKKWTYFPVNNIQQTIYIEELSIGTLNPLNEKVIYIFENGKIEKRIYYSKNTYDFETDHTFIFESEYIEIFDFKKFDFTKFVL